MKRNHKSWVMYVPGSRSILKHQEGNEARLSVCMWLVSLDRSTLPQPRERTHVLQLGKTRRDHQLLWYLEANPKNASTSGSMYTHTAEYWQFHPRLLPRLQDHFKKIKKLTKQETNVLYSICSIKEFLIFQSIRCFDISFTFIENCVTNGVL